VNTALERTMDILKPRVHPYVRTVKDVMAGAVLITTLGAAAMGLFIFWPFIAPLF
jgi:undecaprenol kinase